MAREHALLVPRVGSEADYIGQDTVQIDLSTVDRLRSHRWVGRAFGQFMYPKVWNSGHRKAPGVVLLAVGRLRISSRKFLVSHSTR